MRHIPEDELHAYLDQALSRSQCIEIETHLARCPGCRRERDATAALRDRTTALLARAMPRAARAPDYAALSVRAASQRRHSWRRAAVWAASLAGALVGGWALRAVLDPHPATVAVQVEPSPAAAVPSVGDDQSAVLEPIVLERVTQPPPAPAFAGSPVLLANDGDRVVGRRNPPPDADERADEVDALWTTVTAEEAAEASGGLVPGIPDLPVTGIRLRPGGPMERPLLVVSQRLPSGELVETVEGPVAAVAALVAARLEDPAVRSSEPTRSLPDYLDRADGIERTSRVVVVLARLPADSVSALAQGVVLK